MTVEEAPRITPDDTEVDDSQLRGRRGPRVFWWRRKDDNGQRSDRVVKDPLRIVKDVFVKEHTLKRDKFLSLTQQKDQPGN